MSDDREQNEMQEGTVVDGRYRIVRSLGRGGFATVYEAIHLQLDRPAALKVLDPIASGSAETFKARFMSEARIAANLDHPNIVRIFDFGLVSDGHPYIAMERLQGCDLSTYLQHHKVLDPDRAKRLFGPVLDALQLGHAKGIVHKDLKPSNLFFVKPDSASEKLVVLDFGIARMEADQGPRLTQTGGYSGTPAYMPPEYIRHQIVTPAFDVYQMGLLFIESIVGHRVIDAPTSVAAMVAHCEGKHNIPAALLASDAGQVLAKAIAIDHEERFTNAAQFRVALENVPIDPATLGRNVPSSTIGGGRPMPVMSDTQMGHAMTVDSDEMSEQELSLALTADSEDVMLPSGLLGDIDANTASDGVTTELTPAGLPDPDPAPKTVREGQRQAASSDLRPIRRVPHAPRRGPRKTSAGKFVTTFFLGTIALSGFGMCCIGTVMTASNNNATGDEAETIELITEIANEAGSELELPITDIVQVGAGGDPVVVKLEHYVHAKAATGAVVSQIDLYKRSAAANKDKPARNIAVPHTVDQIIGLAKGQADAGARAQPARPNLDEAARKLSVALNDLTLSVSSISAHYGSETAPQPERRKELHHTVLEDMRQVQKHRKKFDRLLGESLEAHLRHCVQRSDPFVSKVCGVVSASRELAEEGARAPRGRKTQKALEALEAEHKSLLEFVHANDADLSDRYSTYPVHTTFTSIVGDYIRNMHDIRRQKGAPTMADKQAFASGFQPVYSGYATILRM